jgi:hypothetical protein
VEHGLNFDTDPDAGLPDFYLYSLPKRVKIYQMTTKLPDGH